MIDLRDEYQWNEINKTAVLQCKNSVTWWTFAGKIVNLYLAAMLNNKLNIPFYADNLTIKIDESIGIEDIKKLIKTISDVSDGGNVISAFIDTISHYKFHECLPKKAMALMAQQRFYFIGHVNKILEMNIKSVVEY